MRYHEPVPRDDGYIHLWRAERGTGSCNHLLLDHRKRRRADPADAPIKDKAEIKNIQSDGISIFDNQPMKDRFHQKNFDEIKKDLILMFKDIKLD